ncbi:hypothetical protein F7725_008418 [Dissostichus mawsoni]|uniref:CNH domain-containing protein n=1 Tax=Dissostichus mawsoni TaxID=36200 RepID=A0A7J5Y753_DISMA|nr:hypothetical protein F7725_008418 [Dissostichus mawsoni]
MAKPAINGLPPTPKVLMGACFSKVFDGCPLKINCATSWIHPDTKDQYLIFGTEDGIYTLNLNELHEATMEQLYSHNLIGLFEQLKKPGLAAQFQTHRFPDKNPAQEVRPDDQDPRQRAAIMRNPYTGHKYLCGALQSGIVLLQWYEPMQRFMLIKHFDFPLPSPLKVFEMLVVPEQEYPLVCVAISQGSERGQHVDAIHVTQLERDTVLVCLDPCRDLSSENLKIVNLQGRLKSNKKLASELSFDFCIGSVVCLQDSVLAFWKHGMQGKSFKSNEVTQEICDPSRVFRLLGSDRVVVLQSRPTDNHTSLSNLYILAGHENNFLCGGGSVCLSGASVIGSVCYRERLLSGAPVIGSACYRERLLSGAPVIGSACYRERLLSGASVTEQRLQRGFISSLTNQQEP